MADDKQDSGQQDTGHQDAPDTKAHEPPGAPRGEPGDVSAGHEASEYRSHEPPRNSVELSHESPEVVMFEVGEMHSPAAEAPRPTAPPPNPSDAAQSVRTPQARQESAPEQSSGGDDQ
jgi:hypothetical protein